MQGTLSKAASQFQELEQQISANKIHTVFGLYFCSTFRERRLSTYRMRVSGDRTLTVSIGRRRLVVTLKCARQANPLA